MICILYGCTGSGKTWYLQNHLLEKIECTHMSAKTFQILCIVI